MNVQGGGGGLGMRLRIIELMECPIWSIDELSEVSLDCLCCYVQHDSCHSGQPDNRVASGKEENELWVRSPHTLTNCTSLVGLCYDQ